MNALEIIERVRAHDADLVVEQDQLILRGRGDRLPDDLQAELKAHKAEVMVALGATIDAAVGSILPELRPQLPAALRRLPDASLLALVNWSIMQAWFSTVEKLEVASRRNPNSWQGRA